MSTSSIALLREVEAIQIPSGEIIILPQGLEVSITQTIGGSYTIATQVGLARITEENIDALGIDPNQVKQELPEELKDAPLIDRVWAMLKHVYDPEIPVNIVDLGLVYDCTIEQKEEKTIVLVQMTLTAPGCGMGPAIAADAQAKVMQLDDVNDATVDIVWEPAWHQEMISEEGKMELGLV